MSFIARIQKGFTLLEVVIVLALLSIITALLFSGFREYVAYQQFTQSVRDIQLTLQESQSSARLSVGGVEHGVVFGSDTITQFIGPVYTLGEPTNVIRTFSAIEMTPSLSGGGNEIVFSSLSGYPLVTGTVLISGTRYDGTVTLEVTAGGVVQY